MRTYRLALIGFGNVGQGLAQIIRDQGDDIARQLGVQITIVAVSDLLKGSLYDPDGLSPAALLDAVQTSGDLNGVAAPHQGWDAGGEGLDCDSGRRISAALFPRRERGCLPGGTDIHPDSEYR